MDSSSLLQNGNSTVTNAPPSLSLEGSGKLNQAYGILCHRQYSDRIRDALLYQTKTNGTNNDGWLQLTAESSTPSISDNDNTSEVSSSSKFLVIPTPHESGPRKNRTGYSLLVIIGATKSPGELPPMARKQMSWAGRLTNHFAIGTGTGTDTDSTGDYEETLKNLVLDIWSKELSPTYDASNHYRIDVHPKSFNADVCAAFIKHINNEMIQADDMIKLSFSATKVTHAVNIVIQSREEGTSLSSSAASSAAQSRIQNVYWGISSNKEHFDELNSRLNNFATSEVLIEPTDPKTGLDKRIIVSDSSDDTDDEIVEWDAPVSRAYYKLAQVFEDDALLEMIRSLHHQQQQDSNDGTKEEKCMDITSKQKSILSHGTGLDVGASPGGWTQILHNTLHLSNIVAIDPGILAQRVYKLPNVTHLRYLISSDESIKALADHAPYSIIVCDASISNGDELLRMIVETLEKVKSLLLKNRKSDEKDDGGDSNNTQLFALPLCLVITLKLPYKTSQSIDRNIDKARRYIPGYLEQIASLGKATNSGNDDDDSSLKVLYKICHLFANSISERTLIAIVSEENE